MKYLIMAILIVCSNDVRSQELCIKIDSLVISYVPILIQPNVDLDGDFIRNSNNHFTKKVVFKGADTIRNFASILNFRKKADKVRDQVEERMIIDIFSEGRFFSIILGKRLEVIYGNNIYYSNDELLNWLRENIPEWINYRDKW